MKTRGSKTSRIRTLLLLVFMSFALLLLPACGDDEGGNTGNQGPSITQKSGYRLTQASSCEALGDHIEDVAVESLLDQRYSAYLFAVEDANVSGSSSSSSGGDGGRSAPTDYTTTNVQEVGVDEVDIVKTDGSYIYTVRGNELVIVKSWPVEETSEVSRLALTSREAGPGGAEPGYYYEGYGRGLFLHEDRVAVFTDLYEYNDTNPEDNFYGTRITIIDVSDRAQPSVIETRDIEGYFTNARMIGGDIYMVSNSYMELPQDIWELVWDESAGLPEPEYDADPERMEELKDLARPILAQRVAMTFANHDVSEMLPRTRGADGTITSLYDCTDIYTPDTLARLGVLNVIHIDIDQPAELEPAGVLADGWQLYASEDNLYIAMSSRGWWWWGWGASGSNETHIHKFDLDGDNGHPLYTASGKVDGWLLNQFSMSEYQGFLRVATTDNEWTWNEQTEDSEVQGGNHLTILEQQAGDLAEVGAVRDLAPGEQIYSARMMGPRGYIVTFRQTDPLFSFDLSDPTNPQLKGELKINGFSSYMHPVGDDHLLTIGQDADDEGRVTGVHLQFFDVSDLTNPTRTHQQVLSTGDWSSWSEAMWDHHAFTYHAEKGVLAFPINIHNWDENDGENFTGLMVYSATPDEGFAEIGRVSHGDLVLQHWCEIESFYCDGNNEVEYWWTNMRRSIFIEDYVYSLSDVGLKVNTLLNPSAEHAALPW